MFDISGVGAIVKTIGDVFDDLNLSEEEALKYKLEMKKVEANLAMAAMDSDIRRIESINRINALEAQHNSVFVAGWRPFLGWTCGLGFAYKFLLYPFILWGFTIAQGNGYLVGIEPPPAPDLQEVLVLLGGLLGLGGFRTWEKIKGVARNSLRIGQSRG